MHMSMVHMHMAMVALWVPNNMFDILTGTSNAMSTGRVNVFELRDIADDVTSRAFDRDEVQKWCERGSRNVLMRIGLHSGSRGVREVTRRCDIGR